MKRDGSGKLKGRRQNRKAEALHFSRSLRRLQREERGWPRANAYLRSHPMLYAFAVDRLVQICRGELPSLNTIRYLAHA
jgi:hypothetical protein